MVGHLDVRAVDPRVPSSLSRKVVTGLLRHDLGFDGLVVTDSLEMAAVSRRGPARAAVQALRAGNDVALMPADPAAARAGLVKAVRSGALPRERLEQAAARQVALLLHGRGHAGAAPGTGRAASRALSAAAVTVVAGPCRGSLLRARPVPFGDRGLGRGVPDRRRRRRASPSAGSSTASRPSPRARRRSAGGVGSSRRRCSAACRSASPATATPRRPARRCWWRRTRHTSSGASGARFGSRRSATPPARWGTRRGAAGPPRAPGRLPVDVAGISRRGC